MIEASGRLIVYDQAFQIDRTEEEFSLKAIIAHERGHQLIWGYVVMEPAKLSDIRTTLLNAIRRESDDPLGWLAAKIAEARQCGESAESYVALRNLMTGESAKRKRRQRRKPVNQQAAQPITGTPT